MQEQRRRRRRRRRQEEEEEEEEEEEQEQEQEQEQQEEKNAQTCDKTMCGKMVTSCGMTRTSHCALHLLAREHMNNTNAHTTIHSPYGIAGVRSSTIWQKLLWLQMNMPKTAGTDKSPLHL